MFGTLHTNNERNKINIGFVALAGVFGPNAARMAALLFQYQVADIWPPRYVVVGVS